MNSIVHDHIRIVERGINELKSRIVALKLRFQSTKWTDKKSMIDAMSEILVLKERLIECTKTHEMISKNYKTGA